MASLQALRKRLKSIQATGQLAGAMRTASTAKYAKLGRLRGEFAPYAAACRDMLSLLGSAGVRRETETISERDCVVVMGGNRGMCGGFNAELARFLDKELENHPDALILVCGRKAAAHLRERGAAFEEFEISDVPEHRELKAVSDRMRELYASGRVGRVFVVWQRCRNVLIQIPSVMQVLPETGAAQRQTPEGMLLFLPDRATVGAQLAISCLDAQVFELALENALGAQAATLTAMRSACDNAKTAAGELEIMINRRRQAEVTSGVIETASGNLQGV